MGICAGTHTLEMARHLTTRQRVLKVLGGSKAWMGSESFSSLVHGQVFRAGVLMLQQRPTLSPNQKVPFTLPADL